MLVLKWAMQKMPSERGSLIDMYDVTTKYITTAMLVTYLFRKLMGGLQPPQPPSGSATGAAECDGTRRQCLKREACGMSHFCHIGVWHPHLIIIRNLYSPNYSPSFKFVIVLDVFAKKCKLSFFSRYDVNRPLCNLFSVNKQARANCLPY